MFLSSFLKVNKLKKINNLRSSIVLNNFLVNNNFIFFCDINRIKNLILLNFKNEFKKLNCKSCISNQRFIKINDTNLDLKFLGTHYLVVIVPNFKLLLKLIEIVNNKNFFFLYLNNLSTITNITKINLYKKNLNILFNFNFIIYKLILKIYLIINLFIRSIFILLTSK